MYHHKKSEMLAMLDTLLAGRAAEELVFGSDYITSGAADDLKKVRYWIDCGDDDFLSRGNSLLHVALIDKGVPHEYRVRDGAHNWTYWRTGIVDALAFIGDSFRHK